MLYRNSQTNQTTAQIELRVEDTGLATLHIEQFLARFIATDSQIARLFSEADSEFRNECFELLDTLTEDFDRAHPRYVWRY